MLIASVSAIDEEPTTEDGYVTFKAQEPKRKKEAIDVSDDVLFFLRYHIILIRAG